MEATKVRVRPVLSLQLSIQLIITPNQKIGFALNSIIYLPHGGRLPLLWTKMNILHI